MASPWSLEFGSGSENGAVMGMDGMDTLTCVVVFSPRVVAFSPWQWPQSSKMIGT